MTPYHQFGVTPILVTDLCGREAPFITDLDGLRDRMGESNLDYVWDALAERDEVFLGEFSYRVVDDATAIAKAEGK